jgi:hypothetical protein
MSFGPLRLCCHSQISENIMKKKSDWLIPAGLMLLTIVPSIAGAMRVAGIVQGGPVTAENARFFSAPVAVSIHIVGSFLFGFLGALQFSPSFRKGYPRWHRMAGRPLIVAGIAVALTGLYLTMVFPHLETDGPTLFSVRIVVGSAMTLSVLFSIRALVLRRFADHGAWMMRAYALGMGAGTQVFTHVPWIIATGTLPTGYVRDAAMAAGWLINICFVEWRLRRR